MQVVSRENSDGSPHPGSPPLIIEALSLCACVGQRFTAVLEGGEETPRRSYVEAFSAATRSLDVGIVEDKLAGELRLHKVHLSSQQGQLSLLLDKHPHACKTREKQPSGIDVGEEYSRCEWVKWFVL